MKMSERNTPDLGEILVQLRGGPSDGMRIAVEPELTEVSVPGTGAQTSRLVWATYRQSGARTADGVPLWDIFSDG
jgi:hypothetical protein